MRSWTTRRALAIGVMLCVALALPLGPEGARAQDRHDQVVLSQLQSLLVDDAARRAAAGQSEQGLEANQRLEGMPEYARKEILEIVMAIMRERMAVDEPPQQD